jgi:hypothetical protein
MGVVTVRHIITTSVLSALLILGSAAALPGATGARVSDICCESTGCVGGPYQCARIETEDQILTCYKGAPLTCGLN